MKKAFANTRVAVKLRKSEHHEEWYLYLEAYPVFEPGNDKPQRVREYLNRIIKLLFGIRHVTLVPLLTGRKVISQKGFERSHFVQISIGSGNVSLRRCRKTNPSERI